MNPKLKHRKTQKNSTEESIVPLFQIFVGSEFGMDAWEHYMDDPKFSEIMDEYYPMYHDIVFQHLADYVSEHEDIAISLLLKEFSDFVTEYY